MSFADGERDEHLQKEWPSMISNGSEGDMDAYLFAGYDIAYIWRRFAHHPRPTRVTVFS